MQKDLSLCDEGNIRKIDDEKTSGPEEDKGPIAKRLNESGVEFRLIRHRRTINTKDLPEVRGVGSGQIMKNLLFITQQGEPVLCILGCDAEIDTAKLAQECGAPVRLANKDEVIRYTGHPVGDVPSLVQGVRKFLDSSVPQNDEISICAAIGNRGGINLRTEDFLKVLDNCTVAEIRQKRAKTPSLQEIEEFASLSGINIEQAKAILPRAVLRYLFDELSKDLAPSRVAGFISTSFLRVLNDQGLSPDEILIDIDRFRTTAEMLFQGRISQETAETVLLNTLLDDIDPTRYIEENDLEIKKVNLSKVIEQIINDEPNAIRHLMAGEKKVFHFLIGKVIERTGSNIDRRAVAEELTRHLEGVI